jgi:hypothetical protein
VGDVVAGVRVEPQRQRRQLVEQRRAVAVTRDGEGEVLDEVRHAGATGRILAAAGQVADVDRHQVGARVGHQRDPHAVGELEQLQVVADLQRPRVGRQAAEVDHRGAARGERDGGDGDGE